MKRSPIDIKKKIIKLLRAKERSLRELDIKANCGYKTVRNQCEELEFLGIIKMIKQEKNPKTGRPSTSVRLTEYGKKL